MLLWQAFDIHPHVGFKRAFISAHDHNVAVVSLRKTRHTVEAKLRQHNNSCLQKRSTAATNLIEHLKFAYM